MSDLTQLFERLAATHVNRFHSTVTVKENTVGQHTIGMLIMADWVFEGSPDPRLMQAILYHDLPEIRIGDIPYPVKHYSKQNLRDALKEHEDFVTQDMGLALDLPEELKHYLAIFDIFDYLKFILTERQLGNRMVEHMFDAGFSIAHRLVYNLEFSLVTRVSMVLDILAAEWEALD